MKELVGTEVMFNMSLVHVSVQTNIESKAQYSARYYHRVRGS